MHYSRDSELVLPEKSMREGGEGVEGSGIEGRNILKVIFFPSTNFSTFFLDHRIWVPVYLGVHYLPVRGCTNALRVSPWWDRYAFGRAISVRVLLSLNYGTCRILRLLRLRGFTMARPFASARPRVKKAKLLTFWLVGVDLSWA